MSLSQAQLTPTEKAAIMRAAKLRKQNHTEVIESDSAEAHMFPFFNVSYSLIFLWLKAQSNRPKVLHLKTKTTVWMSEKNPCKQPASKMVEKSPDPRPVSGKQKNDALQQPAVQDSDSDDFKLNANNSSSSGLQSGAESDDKLTDADSDDDLLGLIRDSKKLKATFNYEWPQVVAHDNDHDNHANDHSALESDAEDTGLTNKKKSGPCYCPSKQQKGSGKNSKGGKRFQERKQEKPTWNTPEEVTDMMSSDGPPLDDPVLARSIRSCEDDWPSACHIMYSSTGKVNLTEQQPHIQEMLQASITCVHEHILFKNSYLDLQQRRKIMANILMSCTEDGEGLVEVRKQLAKDLKYPEGCIASIHANVRKAVQVHVASHYGLTKGADKRVADLLKNNAYIYPANTKGDPIRTKPFQSMAILNTIKDAFFSDKLAAGVKWHNHLTSIIEDHPDEAELPVAMVALASTAVCFICLLPQKYDRDFNSELYGGIYRTLVGMLNGIFKASEHKFHVLVHSLYKTVYGLKHKTEEPGAAKSLMFLDIEGMVEE
ncbi:hypothetical protein BDR04DRAFT_1112872 [Suillus decipiens]|nr:hypothetical protein BDR04DRAFT_1112872 [Suillus decipiens]